MKYFAKWLPVDGEIKEWDICLKPAFEWGDTIKKFEPPYVEVIDQCEIDNNDMSKYKKVKLRLCTHDIPPEQILGGGSSVYWLHDPKDTNEEKPFKVIGQISDDARWVQENDEFDESEVDLCWWPGGVDSETWNVTSRSMLKDFPDEWMIPQYTYVKIKGPCGHFH